MKAITYPTTVLLAALVSTPSQSRDNGDDAYVHAVATVHMVGRFGGFFKDWCDENVPGQQRAHDAALQAWRAASALDEVDQRAAAVNRSATGALSKERNSLYSKLDRAYGDRAAACQNLERNLLSDFNLKKMYPKEYQLVFSRPLEGAAPMKQVAAAEPETNRKADAAGSTTSKGRIVAMPLRERYVMGYGGMMILKYDPIALYPDGTYSNSIPESLDKVTTNGRWKLENDDYVMSPSGGGRKERISRDKVALPAKPGQKLVGHYSSFSGVGGGGTGTTAVTAWSNYNFAADGTVRFGRGAAASTPKNGDGSVVTRSTTNSAARYSLDGHTITFVLEDGSKQQSVFYFLGRKEDVMVIGGRTLTREK